MYDYHVHSNYSDGEFMGRMVRAAADAGLDGVGFADHCNVSEREHPRRYRNRFGFNLDVTYERRRAGIREYAADHDLRVFDAVEMDYHPADEDEISAFLAEADFEYAVGSVHEIREANVHWDYFADLDERERRGAVEEYFEHLVALVESGLFDIVAHPDIVERNPALRGYATEDHYRAVAEALADSATVPEINAGRVDREYGEFHPNPAFLAVLAEYDVRVTLGSDAHSPGALHERVPRLRDRLADAPVESVELSV
ncbi:MAG: PHP domain-containing protein [Haloarculaceae archaeon]